MPEIAPPTTTPDHPDHVLNCEEAIDRAFPGTGRTVSAIVPAAVAAGWDEETAMAAVANLQAVEPFLAEGEHHEP